MILHVPTINDELHDFDRLFELGRQLSSGPAEVTLDFSQCGFLRQNAVAFLGGLVRVVQSRGRQVTLDWQSVRSGVLKNLTRNGFARAFGYPERYAVGNSIPYREDRTQDPRTLMAYLKRYWLGRSWLNVTPALRDAIVGRMWEIYANAFEHSRSQVGVYSCGQHYPSKHELKLSVVDFGVGIPSNVRTHFGDDSIPASAAIQWAFQPGATTRANGMRRGIGLDLMKDFVRVSGGKLEIFSYEGYAIFDKDREVYDNRGAFFEGTLVNMTLICNEQLYFRLASEAATSALF